MTYLAFTEKNRKAKVGLRLLQKLFVPFLMLTNSLASGASAPKPDIQPLDYQSAQSGDLGKLFQEMGSEVVDPSSNPNLKGLVQKIAGLTEDIWLPKDGKGPIRIVLLHDANANACFIRVPNSNVRVIGVNSKLLSILDDDAQLKFVLGHELEHGSAEISEYVKTLKNKNLSSAFLQRLLAAEENEVDLKSVIYRLHLKGSRADAGLDVLRKLRQIYGDSMSLSHTTFGSRETSLSMAITAMSRELGEDVTGHPELTKIVEELHAFFHSQEWKDLRLIELKKFMDTPIDGFESIFKSFKSTPYDENVSPFSKNFDFYQKKFKVLAEESGLDSNTVLPYLRDYEKKLTTAVLKAKNKIYGKTIRIENPSEFLNFNRAFSQTNNLDHWSLGKEQLGKTQDRIPEWKDFLRNLETQIKAPSMKQILDQPITSVVLASDYHIAAKQLKIPPEVSLQQFMRTYEASLLRATTSEEKTNLINTGTQFFNFLAHDVNENRYTIKKVPDWMQRHWSHFFEINEKNADTYDLYSKILPYPQAKRSEFTAGSAERDKIRSASNDKLFAQSIPTLEKDLHSKLIPAEKMNQYLTKKIDLLAKKITLEKGSSHDLMEIIDEFYRESSKINPLLLKPSPEVQRALRTLKENLAERIMIESKGSFKTTQATLISEFIFPQLDKASPSPFTASQKITELNSILDTEMGKMLLKHQMTYGSLEYHFRAAFQKDADFYRFVTQQGDLIHILGVHEDIGLSPLYSIRGTDKSRLDASEWIIKNQPEKMELAGRFKGVSFEERPRLNQTVFNYLKQETKKISIHESNENIAKTLTQLLEQTDRLDRYGELFFKSLSALDAQTRNRVIRIYSDVYANKHFTRNDSDLIIRDKIAEMLPDFAKKDPPEALAELFLEEKLYGKPEPWKDEVIKRIRLAAEKNPNLQEKLLNSKIAKKLYYDSEKVSMAVWQLENSFPELMQSKPTSPLQVRKEIHDLQKKIDFLMEKPSSVKDQVVHTLEAKLQTTLPESKIFEESRIQLKSWVKAKELVFLDIPTVANKAIKSPEDSLELIEYLLSPLNDRIPKFIQKLPDSELFRPRPYQDAKRMFSDFRSKFRETSVHGKNYFLQSFLDRENGALASEATTEKIFKDILGKRYHDPVFREVFIAYLESVPTYEKNMIIGHVLASMANKSLGSASIADILSAMGPFGVKAGQFIKANGLASPEILKELEHIFDRAQVPPRWKILADVEKMYGKMADHIIVGDLIGSGSVNYVVKAEIIDKTGAKIPAVLRIQHEFLEGKIANEDKIWEKLIERLRLSPNPEIRKLAPVLEEARITTMRTLEKGGSELDLRFERENAKLASIVYGKEPSPTTNFSIETGKPIENAEKWIKPEFLGFTDVYEHVEATSLKNVKDPVLRANLSEQIVRSELDAVFKGKVFDPDGHPGNWLIDLEKQRLVRIDYSQLFDGSTGDHIDSFKRVFRNVLKSNRSKEEVTEISRLFSNVFDHAASPEMLEKAIQKSLSSSLYRDSKFGIQKLFAFRDGVESYLRDQGIESVVRMNLSSRNAISAIGKVSAFKEHLGSQRFGKVLLEYLDLKPKDVAASVAKERVAQFFESNVKRVKAKFEKDLILKGGTKCDFKAKYKAFLNQIF